MDVHCATCGEPWDTYQLRHDEVHETPAGHDLMIHRLNMEDWDEEMCKFAGLSKKAALKACPPPPEPTIDGNPIEKWEGKLTDFWRGQFKQGGWEFGTSVVAVLRCPCCPKEGILHQKVREAEELANAEARRANVQLLSELLEGDEDGQVADNELALRHA